MVWYGYGYDMIWTKVCSFRENEKTRRTHALHFARSLAENLIWGKKTDRQTDGIITVE